MSTRGLHIGLIGGIGVAATTSYYEKLCKRIRADGGHRDVTIVTADIFGLIQTSLNDEREKQADAYVALIQRLKDAGCDCAAITSLGGHFCFEETTKISPLPLVSAIAPLDGYFASEGLKIVGLLGTEIAMRTKFFGQLDETQAVAPDQDLVALGQTYQHMATSGICTDAQRAGFFEAGREMITQQGADAVVLAGTDLTLAFDGFDPGYRVIDALDVHVDVLARLAMGETTLESIGVLQ